MLFAAFKDTLSCADNAGGSPDTDTGEELASDNSTDVALPLEPSTTLVTAVGTFENMPFLFTDICLVEEDTE